MERFTARVAPGAPDLVGITADPPSDCSDDAFILEQPTTRWYDLPVSYRVKDSTVPINVAAVRNNVAQADNNWENVVNNCNHGDNVSWAATLSGNTGNSNINSDGTCHASPDGLNVVAFGSLTPSSALAYACWWFVDAPGGGNTAKKTVESDMKLDTSGHTWNADSNCETGKFQVESVATHEFGHWLGIDDVNEAAHGNLTMSEAIASCSLKEQTLGKGDWLAAETLY